MHLEPDHEHHKLQRIAAVYKITRLHEYSLIQAYRTHRTYMNTKSIRLTHSYKQFHIAKSFCKFHFANFILQISLCKFHFANFIMQTSFCKFPFAFFRSGYKNNHNSKKKVYIYGILWDNLSLLHSSQKCPKVHHKSHLDLWHKLDSNHKHHKSVFQMDSILASFKRV